jgi:carbonic anhydrase/acetyltransferase-like protein (isoleucine patch superfamily)
VTGDVELGEDASVWFTAVLRADTAPIRVGRRTNIQDGCVLHVNEGEPCVLGDDVTLGHGAIVHAATVEDCCLIGIRATVLSGARIGKGSVIGAGALVTEGKEIPPGSLVMGVPGKVVRQLGEAELEKIKLSAVKYVNYAAEYKTRYPDG